MQDINYIAVIVSAVIMMAIGMLWYGPIMGKKWMKVMGIKKEDAKKGDMSKSMIWGAVTALITSYVLASLISMLGAADAMAGATVAFWAWLGFVVTSTASAVIWEGKKKELYWIYASYSLVTYLIIGAILAVWK